MHTYISNTYIHVIEILKDNTLTYNLSVVSELLFMERNC